MNFLLEDVDGIKILRIKEERVDTNVAPELKAQLLMLIESDGNKILVDMSEAEYADSSGLGALLLGVRQARDAGIAFALCNVQKRVQSLIDIAQLGSVMTVYKNDVEALANMK